MCSPSSYITTYLLVPIGVGEVLDRKGADYLFFDYLLLQTLPQEWPSHWVLLWDHQLAYRWRWNPWVPRLPLLLSAGFWRRAAHWNSRLFLKGFDHKGGGGIEKLFVCKVEMYMKLKIWLWICSYFLSQLRSIFVLIISFWTYCFCVILTWLTI